MQKLARIPRTIRLHHAPTNWNVSAAPRFLRSYSSSPVPPPQSSKHPFDPVTSTILGASRADGDSGSGGGSGGGEGEGGDGGLVGSETLGIGDEGEHPDLLYADPLLDLHESITFPPDRRSSYSAKVIVRNDPSLFRISNALEAGVDPHAMDAEGSERDGSNSEEDDNPLATLPLSVGEIRRLHRYSILTRRVTQQTGKGKIHRMYSMMIVGNGDGLVGLGEGKAEEVPEAQTKALAQAVRNMDYVQRFEKRTIFTEMETKLGATRIIMRPRPVGFGLRCNPNIHQILKAAGIKDISAKVWGSRNKINVIKACFRMIQAGHAPTAMGDGFGGGARNLNKGRGIMSREEMERARGRKLADLRTW